MKPSRILVDPICVRRATAFDRRAILGIDHVAQNNARRRKWIAEALHDRAVWVAVANGAVLGFVVLRRNFFDRPFVELLYVNAERRRSGIGVRLLTQVETHTFRQAKEIWTSSNQSNKPMRRLLISRGYSAMGRVAGLEAGDPEIFYMKKADG